MSNEKNYHYYQISGSEVAALNASYEPFEQRRAAALEQLLADSGAVGFTFTRRSFGDKPGLVRNLAYPVDHDFGVPVLIKDRNVLDGKPVAVFRGKGNSSAGRELNAKLDAWIAAANKELNDAPRYTDYLIDHYGIHCSECYGNTIINTYGGKAHQDDDVLLFAIPIVKKGPSPEIPASFVQITYGQFYDLSQS